MDEFNKIKEMLFSKDKEMKMLGIRLFHSLPTRWMQDGPTEVSSIDWWTEVTLARMRIYEKRNIRKS